MLCFFVVISKAQRCLHIFLMLNTIGTWNCFRLSDVPSCHLLAALKIWPAIQATELMSVITCSELECSLLFLLPVCSGFFFFPSKWTWGRLQWLFCSTHGVKMHSKCSQSVVQDFGKMASVPGVCRGKNPEVHSEINSNILCWMCKCTADCTIKGCPPVHSESRGVDLSINIFKKSYSNWINKQDLRLLNMDRFYSVVIWKA